MPLNLITDPWIPVRTTGAPRVIRPDEIAEADVLWPDWPRADLNVACLELLIGLVFLADPPEGTEDWKARRKGAPTRLRQRMAPLAPAFGMAGDGPRFLQELGGIEGGAGSPEMLFLDSAGGNTAANNADLFVRRGRYSAMTPELAAIALHTLQSQAPSGGAGNRTSMRGGGPLVTLADPGGPLWDLVWANVPDGAPQGTDALPWMHPTRTSEKGKLPTAPPRAPNSTPAEAFFGMPRRLRLDWEDGLVKGVAQRPWGTQYDGWLHPLTPYYQDKSMAWLPKHPSAGAFGYRQWLGVVLEAAESPTLRRAEALRRYDARRFGDEYEATVLVAGWSMDNMKPREFIMARAPLVSLDPDMQEDAAAMVSAAGRAATALRGALKPVIGADDAKSVQLATLQERFYIETESAFGGWLRELAAGEAVGAGCGAGWRDDMRRTALAIFDGLAVPALAERPIEAAGRIVDARRNLLGFFAGKGKSGALMLGDLELEAA